MIIQVHQSNYFHTHQDRSIFDASGMGDQTFYLVGGCGNAFDACYMLRHGATEGNFPATNIAAFYRRDNRGLKNICQVATVVQSGFRRITDPAIFRLLESMQFIDYELSYTLQGTPTVTDMSPHIRGIRDSRKMRVKALRGAIGELLNNGAITETHANQIWERVTLPANLVDIFINLRTDQRLIDFFNSSGDYSDNGYGSMKGKSQQVVDKANKILSNGIYTVKNYT